MTAPELVLASASPRRAREKAEAVAAERPGALVVGGDTVVVDGDRVLGKPADADEARAMLRSLAGRTHRVAGVTLPGTGLVTGRGEHQRQG